MSGMTFIETGISESEQMSSRQNASLHGAPGGKAISIDTEVRFPDGITTEEGMKAYLREKLAPLMAEGWNFRIAIGDDIDTEKDQG